MWSLINILVFFIVIIEGFADDYVVSTKKFPPNFMFGVASAAYQVEGAWNEDGKGENIWDHMIHNNPDSVIGRQNADISCDFYHKYKEDVANIKDLGVSHFRLSISWARILPNGLAENINELGVTFYKNLIKELKNNEIEPLVTIFHWDLPQHLQDMGGFLNDSFVDWYADYARLCFELFGDDVKYWATFNEPAIFCPLGYGTGDMAPNVVSSGVGEYICGHNLIKAHAAAWHIYDKEFRKKQGGKVSLVTQCDWYGPETNSTEDINAAESRVQFELGWFANPVILGDYPEVMKTRIGVRSKAKGLSKSRLPEFTEAEKNFINGTNDYFSINTYNTHLVSAIPGDPIVSPPARENDAGAQSRDISGHWGMTELLNFIKTRYNNPEIIITENGFPDTTGTLEDNERIEYVQNQLSRVRDAIDRNTKVFGYTLWSFLDDFEWNQGYSLKYGIYNVDFNSTNTTRTPKDSALWYTNFIQTRCLVDHCDE